MNAILNSKDIYTPPYPERCDQYQNHFISRVLYNSDLELYIVIENSRGTINDTEARVYVFNKENKNLFSYEHEYVSPSYRSIDTIKVSEFPVLDARVDSYVNKYVEMHNSKILTEITEFKSLCDIVFSKIGSQKWDTDRNRFRDTFSQLLKEYKYIANALTKAEQLELLNEVCYIPIGK